MILWKMQVKNNKWEKIIEDDEGIKYQVMWVLDVKFNWYMRVSLFKIV